MKNNILLISILPLLFTGCMKDEGPDMPTGDGAAVVINEAHSRGKDSQYPLDWVELYNKSTADVDISGYVLSDKADMSEKITIPAGTTLRAHSFLMVVVDTEEGFGLSSDGDVVYLYNSGGQNIDNIEFGPMETSESWAANPDGSDTFQMMTPTPGASNTGAVVPPPATSGGLYINEVKVSDAGSDTKDWVELYNGSNEAIDLSGYKLYDSGGAEKAYTIPAGTSIASKGFFTLTEEESFSFGLSAGGESVTLLDADGSNVDFVSSPAGLEDNEFPAYARTSDGGSIWAKTATPTKNASNGGDGSGGNGGDGGGGNGGGGGSSDYADLFINEVKVSDAGADTQDWIELYNAGDEPIDLSGLKLHDGGGISKAYTIASGTIAAGGFLTLTEGEHFSFGLGKSGEVVKLLDADDNEIDLIDLTPAGALEDDEYPAYARTTDGGTMWAKTATPTKNASNAGGGTVDPPADPDPTTGTVVLNEIKVSDYDGDGDDYIELYNTGDAAVDLAGWAVADSKNNWYTITSGSIAANGFFTLTEGTDFSFGLSADGEEMKLRNAGGTTVDEVTTPSGLEDDTFPAYARTTDGTGTWNKTATPTKNLGNMF